MPFPGLCHAALTLSEWFSGLPLSYPRRSVVHSKILSCIKKYWLNFLMPRLTHVSALSGLCVCCQLSELFVYTFLTAIINSSGTRPLGCQVDKFDKFEVWQGLVALGILTRTLPAHLASGLLGINHLLPGLPSDSSCLLPELPREGSSANSLDLPAICYFPQ